ncbi:MAG: methyltransferase domain-containing protein [Steroidobacteraceae bacterium]|nr:methyltransferase domain-containing protein [Steroidobacteraceae bacterium]
MSPKRRYVPALGHDWLTPCYDVIVGVTTRERLFKRALIEQARLEPGQRVLDLASGTGTLAIWMKQQQPSLVVSGVDGDPAILAIAGRKAASAEVVVEWVHALSTELPFPAQSFDRITSSLFFHHLAWDDKVRTVREAWRVLRPGGELHVADWGRPASPLQRGFFLAIQLLDGFENTKDNLAGRLVELFEDVGFVDVAAPRAFRTMFGTLALYRATKPAHQGAAAS